MSCIQSVHATPAGTSPVRNAASPLSASPAPAHEAAIAAPSPTLVVLLAAGAGLGVASLYYAQPMLGVLAADIGASTQAAGFVPTLTQLGYALAILLLAPLGDRYDRKRIILIKAAVLCLSLLLAGAAPSISLLLVASLLIGLSATLTQDIVPAAAAIAPEQSRGKIVGMVMTGLLLGILLSRVVSGYVAEHLGWRAMFVIAAGAIALITLALWRGMPHFKPTTQLGYGALLGSVLKLWQQHGELRRATLAQGLLATGFSAFWSTLAVMLHGAPFHLGASVAGAFGLAGAAGALMAPVSGRLADRYGPEVVSRLGAGTVVLSFAAMFAAPLLPVSGQLWLLVIAIAIFDLGFQAALIAHQSIVYRIDAGARSRLNAVLVTGIFLGMATGSALGALLLAQWGWVAVLTLATLSTGGALTLRLLGGAPRGVVAQV